MKEMYFKKKITRLRNVRDFLTGGMIAQFIGAALFIDCIELLVVCMASFAVFGVIYIYVDCKVKAYRKTLYYYKKRIYSRPIRLYRAA